MLLPKLERQKANGAATSGSGDMVVHIYMPGLLDNYLGNSPFTQQLPRPYATALSLRKQLRPRRVCEALRGLPSVISLRVGRVSFRFQARVRGSFERQVPAPAFRDTFPG